MKKNRARKEILALLNLEESEPQIEVQDESSPLIENNKDIIENNKDKQEIIYPCGQKELDNLEKEISLINDEVEEHYKNVIYNNKDEKYKDPFKELFNPDLEEDELIYNIDKSISSNEINEEINEEDEYLGYDKNANDKYNNEGKNLNENNEKIIDENNSLNNLKNTFIRASKMLDFQNNISLKGDKNYNNYDNMQPKFFNKLKSVHLDKNKIEEINLVGKISEINHWFNNIVYEGKKFNIISNFASTQISDKVSYYCSLHRTTKGTEKNDNNKRISKCNARIVYIKEESEYYMDLGHQNFCKENNNAFSDKLSDINKEVKNYKAFRRCLFEFLDAHPLVNYKIFKEKAINLYYKILCKFEIKKNTFKNIYNSWKKTSKLFTR